MRPPLTMIGQPIVLRRSTMDSATHQPDAAPVAFWDVDGTLIPGDSLLPFLHRFAGAASLDRTVVSAMASTRVRPYRTLSSR
jgi:hypothetical protein